MVEVLSTAERVHEGVVLCGYVNSHWEDFSAVAPFPKGQRQLEEGWRVGSSLPVDIVHDRGVVCYKLNGAAGDQRFEGAESLHHCQKLELVDVADLVFGRPQSVNLKALAVCNPS